MRKRARDRAEGQKSAFPTQVHCGPVLLAGVISFFFSPSVSFKIIKLFIKYD